ncbi:MAG: AI-2E family transporter [Pontimonas sp.]|jgi:putative heme transporter|nr:AI-2E family transporter [Pontimonas sp.]MDP4817235.1 AI-2E family transporter [Pontimonas sp.]MDP5128316.1 AI-2E family transporter [Pontimonas sp.]
MIASRKSARVQSPRVVIPAGLERATQWSWRLLLIAAAITLGLFVVAQLSFLIIPLFIAVLLAALVAPVSVGLRKLRFPRWLATLTTIIVFLAAVGGLFYLVINEVIRGWESLQARTILAYDDFVQYLLDSPLQVTEAQLNEWVTALATEFNIDSSWVLSGALSVTSSVGSWLVGAGIAIFALIFFIHDGARIWEYVVSWFPKLARPAILGASRSGWNTLIEFVKVQILVAFVDALGIGLGAFFLGLPLVVPIAVAVFLGAFVPIVGGTVAAALAILVALVYEGPVTALIMLIIVLAVQQLEGQILQPLIMGPALRIHPLAVVLSIAAGGYLAGIAGVLFAVPVVAFTNVVIRYLAAGDWRGDPDALPTNENLVVR